MDQKEFLELLERVRIELLSSRTAFATWLDLWPETASVINILDYYKGFFEITRQALLDRCFIKIGNLTDSKHKKVPSFYVLLKALENTYPTLGSLNPDELRKKLASQRKVEQKVRNYRNKIAAHVEIGASPEPVFIGEMESILDTMESVFNEIHGLVNSGRHFSFELWERDDTEKLLNDLITQQNIVPKANLVAWTATNQGASLGTYLVPAQYFEPLLEAIGTENY